MSWERTRARWQALREVGAAIEATGGAALPWDENLQEIFGDREGMLAALRYRWQLTVQAQLDPDLPPETLTDTRRALTAANQGLLKVLARHSDLSRSVGTSGVGESSARTRC